MSSMGLASAAEQLKMMFAPLQTVSSLTCNWTPSGGSAKDENSLSTVVNSQQISPYISTSDLVIRTPVSRTQNQVSRVEELKQRKSRGKFKKL